MAIAKEVTPPWEDAATVSLTLLVAAYGVWEKRVSGNSSVYGLAAIVPQPIVGGTYRSSSGAIGQGDRIQTRNASDFFHGVVRSGGSVWLSWRLGPDPPISCWRNATHPAANERSCGPLWKAAGVPKDATSSVTFLFVQSSRSSGVSPD